MKNNVGYRNPCKLCKAAYLGETGENMHTRMKSHLTKFNSKVKATQESSAFFKHLSNTHGIKKSKSFEDYFEVIIVKAYKKPLTRCIEEGTFIVHFKGKVFKKTQKSGINPK